MILGMFGRCPELNWLIFLDSTKRKFGHLKLHGLKWNESQNLGSKMAFQFCFHDLSGIQNDLLWSPSLWTILINFSPNFHIFNMNLITSFKLDTRIRWLIFLSTLYIYTYIFFFKGSNFQFNTVKKRTKLKYLKSILNLKFIFCNKSCSHNMLEGGSDSSWKIKTTTVHRHLRWNSITINYPWESIFA